MQNTLKPINKSSRKLKQKAKAAIGKGREIKRRNYIDTDFRPHKRGGN